MLFAFEIYERGNARFELELVSDDSSYFLTRAKITAPYYAASNTKQGLMRDDSPLRPYIDPDLVLKAMKT